MIDLLLMIIGGAIIGWLGKKLARGDVRIPTWLTVACGIGGVLVGNFLYIALQGQHPRLRLVAAHLAGRRRGGPGQRGGRLPHPAAREGLTREGTAQPGQAELGHPLGVPVGDPGEHPADGGQVEAGTVDAAGEQRREGVALGRDPLGLGERLPHQPTAPQGEATPTDGVAAIAWRIRSTTKSAWPESSSEAMTRSRVALSRYAAISR